MKKERFDVRLGNRADRMLLAHTEFLAGVSPPAARKLLAEFRNVKNRLAEDPYMYPYADELDVPGIPSDLEGD